MEWNRDGAAWEDLMRRAQAGERTAYAELLLALRRWLGTWFQRRLPAPRVDDAVQETLIAVHEKRHTWDPTRPLLPWLQAIAHYKWVDAIRGLERAAEEPLADVFAARDEHAASEDALALRDLLCRLKPAQAEAIRLVKLDGLSVEEASQRTGQGVSLVKVNIHRGLAKLSQLVAEARPS